MTISVRDIDTDSDAVQQTDLPETIDFILDQPSETFEMFQNSFLTKPATALTKSNRTTQLISVVHEKPRHDSTANLDDKKDDSDEFQDITLKDGLVNEPAILSNERKLPLPKVDNFVNDIDDNDFVDLSCFNSCTTTEESPCGTSKNEKSLSAETYEVVIINSINENDPLPGQLTQENLNEVFSQSTINETAQKKVVLEIEVNEDLNEDYIFIINPTCTDDELVDIVTPFRLDENFDYDNIKLTPKFGAEILDLASS